MGDSLFSENAMAPMQRGEFLDVWFETPVLGVDPDDGFEFNSDRQRLPARWARENSTETTCIDDLGVIVGTWPTLATLRIE